MKISLKHFWPRNHSYCELEVNCLNGLLIAEQHIDIFIDSITTTKSKLMSVGVAKAGFDITKKKTVDDNLAYKNITDDERQVLQQLCDFSFTNKVTNLTACEQQMVRILYAITNNQLAFIDGIFETNDQLTDTEITIMLSFIRQLQKDANKIIIPCFSNQIFGQYFDKLYALQDQTLQFLPLK